MGHGAGCGFFAKIITFTTITNLVAKNGIYVFFVCSPARLQKELCLFLLSSNQLNSNVLSRSSISENNPYKYQTFSEKIFIIDFG